MIGFLCIECKSESSTFNDTLGERACDGCGLIHLTNPFEETISWTGERWEDRPNDSDSSGHLGSYIMKSDITNKRDYFLRQQNIKTNSITSSDRHMYALSYNILWKYAVASNNSDKRKKVPIYYKALQENRILSGLTLETRAAGLTYFILKEAKINISLKEHSKKSEVSIRQIVKCAKKIATFHKKAHVFAYETPIEDAIKVLDTLPRKTTPLFRVNTLKFVEYVHSKYEYSCIRYTLNTLGAIIWLSGRIHNTPLSQVLISETVGCSEIGLRQSVHKICNLSGIDRTLIESYEIDDLVNGVRHG